MYVVDVSGGVEDKCSRVEDQLIKRGKPWAKFPRIRRTITEAGEFTTVADLLFIN